MNNKHLISFLGMDNLAEYTMEQIMEAFENQVRTHKCFNDFEFDSILYCIMILCFSVTIKCKLQCKQRKDKEYNMMKMLSVMFVDRYFFFLLYT